MTAIDCSLGQLVDEIGAILTPAWEAIHLRHIELPPAEFVFCPLEYGNDAAMGGHHAACVRLPGRYRDYRDGVTREPVRVELTRSGLRPAVSGQPDRTFASLLHRRVHVVEWVRPGQAR